HTLSVTQSAHGEVSQRRSDAGEGAESGESGTIDCGSGTGDTACTWDVPDGSTITLLESPDAGYTFSGWSGDCGGSGVSCSVRVTRDAFVTPTFTSLGAVFSLGVTVAGNGAVNGGGISCSSGATCTADEAAGSTVLLTATPDAGYDFAGWTGACTGTKPTCAVQLTADAAVTATFSPPQALTVTVTGAGTVGGGGIGCSSSGGSGCSANEALGTAVTLTAAPAQGSTFTGWGGDCSGTAPTCTVTMTGPAAVTATFAIPLSVSVTGNGTVTGGGISCTASGGSGCTAAETTGASVVLSETPSTSATFGGWGGACSGTATTCTVTMSQAQSVTATFATAAAFPVTVSVTGGGTVSGSGI